MNHLQIMHLLLQEYFFKHALKEANINIKEPYLIDHKLGNNINEGKRYPIIFPIERVNKINHIKSKTKKIYNYHFKGLLTDKKNWVLDFKNKKSLIHFNDYSRDKKLKYEFDRAYFLGMCRSNFTLCPTDVYPWSYRFFEAIMCDSIPILDDDELDIFSHQFKFYRKSEEHIYNKEWVLHNTNVFLNTHTLKQS